jgi:hypothetical protein
MVRNPVGGVIMSRFPALTSAGLALALGLLPGSGALACSCAQPTAEELMRSAAAIFTGVAQRSEPATQGEAVTTFEVIEGYKGVVPGALVRVRHASGSSASCGVRFAIGERHTLTTYREEVGTTLFANLCSVAIFRSAAGEELLRRLRR